MADAPACHRCIEVIPVPCFKDNYAYVIATQSGDAWVVDPSDAAPPAAVIAERSLTLRGIIATHHHWDHTNGIIALLERYPPANDADPAIIVAAHASDAERITGLTHPIDAPADRYVATGLRLTPDIELQARHIPGHTTGAIAWLIPPATEGAHAPDVFTGDTLFAAGCGRLFEGTPAQMHASLHALTLDLPDDSRLWFGHEYTAANLRFAAAAEPDNADVVARQASLPACTTPTTVALEKATNPFVRADSVAEMAARRAAKDAF